MATVYLAVDEGPAGFVKLKVVKQLHPELAAEPEFLQLFLEEARLAARLSHANIVQTFEVGYDGTRHSIVMEYLEGEPLSSVLARLAKAGRGLPLAIGLWVMIEVLAGLHYAHELTDFAGAPLRVAHRDVSPQNVLLTHDGAVKVLDFGIAKAADSLVKTRTGNVRGKTTYMAPEQALGGVVDRRADLFACGILLWEMVTGRRMWAGLTDVDIFTHLAEGKIQSPRSVAPDVAPELEAICMRALAIDPNERYATALELQDDLEDHLERAGHRAGARQVAELMDELFRNKRARVRAEIERAVAQPGASPLSATSSGSVAVLAVPVEASRDRPIGPPRASPAGPAEPPLADVTGDRSGKGEPRSQPGAPVPPPPTRSPPGLAIVGIVVVLGGVGTWAAASHRRGPATTAEVDGVAPAAPSATCKSGSSCGAPSGAGVCVSGSCVGVSSGSCAPLPGSVTSGADVLWFGGLGPADSEEGKESRAGLTMALRDFNEVAHGLAPRSGSGSPRALALVMCSDEDPGAVSHLTETVRVPVVFGSPSGAREGESLVRATSLSVGYVPGASSGGSSWHLALDASSSVEPAARAVGDLVEPWLRREMKGPLRVAVVREGSGSGLATSNAVLSALRFNGRPALENGHDFSEVVVEGGAAPAGVESLVSAEPHVVLVAGGAEGALEVVRGAEKKWRGRTRPVYVLAYPGSEGSVDEGMRELSGVGSRVLRVRPATTESASVRFQKRYAQETGHAPGPAASAAYDSFYVVAYATFLSSWEEPLTGTRVGDSLATLSRAGEAMDIAPGKIFDTFDRLRRGTPVSLAGASLDLRLDVATRSVEPPFVLLCSSPSPSPPSYDPSAHRWSGAIACR